MTTMRLFILLMTALTSAGAFAAEPFGGASIEGGDGIVPGQQVHVVVDVFAPDFFTSPPQFPLFEVPDALVTLSGDRAQNLVHTIDGVQYSGIRKSYAVVAEKTGSFALPPIEIELGYSSNGNAVKAKVTVVLPSFEVGKAVTRTATQFAARNLAITQSFDRDPARLKVGDALVRTIVVFAEDTQAMLMPSVDVGEAAGIVRYVKPPVLADGVERRGIGRSVDTGNTRTETVVYTTSTEGRFSIPAISYPWFDVDGRSFASATLPSVAVVVAGAAVGDRLAPTLDQESTPSAWKTEGLLAVILIGVVDLAAAVFVWRRFPAIRAGANAYRERRRNSPRRRLHRLRAVIQAEPEDAIYRELQEWSRRLGFRTIAAWIGEQQNPTLSSQITILERRLFRSHDAHIDRAALASAITLPSSGRKRFKSALPELNPSADHPLLPPLLQ